MIGRPISSNSPLKAVTEQYLAADLALPELGSEPDAQALVEWASAAACTAAAEDVYREKEGRRTVRLRRGEDVYFLKYHGGIGWREVWKNVCRGRPPVSGADNEYVALTALRDAGMAVPEVVAFARVGQSPARRRSAIVTRALRDTVSLEDYCATWQAQPPAAAQRIALVRHVAQIARQMHSLGVQHRDFYLCHFHLLLDSLRDGKPRSYLIDLHRARVRLNMPRRWRIKDLAALYFSAMNCGLTRRDCLRFMYLYNEGGLRKALGEDARMWRAVSRKARRMRAQEARSVMN